MVKPGDIVDPIPEIVHREERKRAEREKKDWKPRNVVLYTRVSTSHQAKDGYSLEDQDETLKAYCSKYNYNVIKVFVDGGKSATGVEKRVEFREMIDYCMNNYKKIYAVVINVIDRFFRNAKLHAIYRDKLADYGIRLRSPRFCFKLRPDAAEMKAAAESQGFSEALSDTAKKSRAKTLRDGREAGKVPIGYLQVRDTTRSRGCVIEVDPKRAPIVAEAIKAFVFSSRTRQNLFLWAIEKGLTNPKTERPVSRNTFYRIFENPKYGGEQIDATGNFRKSVHPPIVPKETMRLSIAKALGGDPTRRVPHDRSLDGIPLRQVLLCPECRKRLSGSKSPGKMGPLYGYYHLPRHEPHCSSKKLRLSSPDINEAFLDVLERLRTEPVVFDLIELFVRDRQQDRVVSVQDEANALAAERDRIRAVLDGLVDKWAEGKMDDEAYRSAVSRNEGAIVKVEARLEELKTVYLPVDDIAFRATTALEHPDVTWNLLSDDERNRMAHALFPDGISFDKNMKPVMIPEVLHGGLITLERKPVWRKTWWRKRPARKALGVKP